MAKVIVEVYACDRCGMEPANTWIITGPGGAPRQIDLCDQHGAPIGNAYALARAMPQASRAAHHRHRSTRTSPSAPTPTSTRPEPEPIWR